MLDWQRILVLAGTAVFLLFLVWRMRPGFRVRAARVLTVSTLQARAKARAATSPRDRAAALCEAGDTLASGLRSPWPAIALYMRGLRADPSWPEPIHKLRELCWEKHPRALERILWRRLASVPWEGSTRPTAAAVAQALADLYGMRLRNRVKAASLANVARELGQRRTEADQPKAVSASPTT